MLFLLNSIKLVCLCGETMSQSNSFRKGKCHPSVRLFHLHNATWLVGTILSSERSPGSPLRKCLFQPGWSIYYSLNVPQTFSPLLEFTLTYVSPQNPSSSFPVEPPLKFPTRVTCLRSLPLGASPKVSFPPLGSYRTYNSNPIWHFPSLPCNAYYL